MPFEIAADRAAFFSVDDDGASATYTPAGGAAVSCTVLLRQGVEVVGGQIDNLRGTHTVIVRKSEVTAPARDATFAVTDPVSAVVTSYRVERIVKDDGGILSVACTEA